MKKVYDVSTIGGRLKALRCEAGYSQEELASLLMLKQYTLSKYENNEHDMPTDIIARVSKLLDTTPTYLIWGNNDDSEWLVELDAIAGKIKNPKLREAAIKQMKALADLE